MYNVHNFELDSRMLFVAFKIGHVTEFVELIDPTGYKRSFKLYIYKKI